MYRCARLFIIIMYNMYCFRYCEINVISRLLLLLLNLLLEAEPECHSMHGVYIRNMPISRKRFKVSKVPKSRIIWWASSICSNNKGHFSRRMKKLQDLKPNAWVTFAILLKHFVVIWKFSIYQFFDCEDLNWMGREDGRALRRRQQAAANKYRL